MEFGKILKNMKGTIVIQAEGFYIERFINLCKIQNVEIWNVRYITAGLLELTTKTNGFKDIKEIAKKTKCRVKIKKKKGVYFILFKYRKRRLFAYLTILIFMLVSILSTFILNIDISGNQNISDVEILNELKNAGITKWRNKLFINKSKIINYLRTNMYEIAWVGMKIEGTTAKVEIVEKTIEEEDATKDLMGNIVASKSGVITKIIAENGNALLLTGSYIEKGMVAISGTIPSEILGDTYVHANGILKVKNEYDYETREDYLIMDKKFTGKKKFGIGLRANNKEYILKYLPKNKLYDINKKEKSIALFLDNFFFVFNIYSLYNLEEVNREYEEVARICKNKYKKYLEDNVSKDAEILDERIIITKGEKRYKIFSKLYC